jgi:uncharacterized protein (UPF0548 family)
MGLRFRRPTGDELAAVLDRCRSDTLSYEPVGVATDRTTTPPGLHRHRWSTRLADADAFATGADAIRVWAVHRGAGLAVAADGPIAPGTNVAMSAPLPLGHVIATCRIVAVIDEPDRYGFAYGTLTDHPERGEEAFTLTRDEDGVVHFDVDAISAPVDLLARLVPPVANLLQDRAARRYLSAMQEASTPSP